MNTGSRIARARRLLDLTQAELSTHLGISREHLASLETDAKGPSQGLLERLAQLLARRLLNRIVTRAAAARQSNSGDALTTSVQRQRLGQFRQTIRGEAGEVVRALAHAIVAGQAVSMERRAWLRLLGAKPRLLRGVPPSGRVDGVPVYDAPSVGLALEAAAHGENYSELAADRDPKDGPALQEFWIALGMTRLDLELSLRAEWIESCFETGLARSELSELRARLAATRT
jgi:transcriptional regulator with XRE-family HTH domain